MAAQQVGDGDDRFRAVIGEILNDTRGWPGDALSPGWMTGNIANLQKATAARTARAAARAEAALTAMIKVGEPVTFRGLAARSGVSLDFLYRNTAIRARIERRRTAQPARSRPLSAAGPAPDHPSSVVRALTAQLADLKRRHRALSA